MAKERAYFNTSHVSINRSVFRSRQNRHGRDFNTSHVSINLEGSVNREEVAGDFNTSHVSINQLEKEQEVAG